MQALINGGLITGIFLVLVAIATGLFARAKNNADATNAIVGGAKVVVDMNVEELLRKDSKIVKLYGVINRLRAYARDLASRLEHSGNDVPPYPTAMYAEEDDV